MYQKIFVIVCFALLGQQVFSQTPVVKKDAQISPEMQKQAVGLLRETLGEVNNLRTLENRIGFSSELASMLWYQDEKEARAMFTAMIGDFNQLLAQYDSQLNALGGETDEMSYYGGFLGGGDQSEKSKLTRKFAKAMNVRQQIAMSIAEHDAKFAFDFYDNSLRLVSSEKLRKQFEAQDAYFQTRLIQQIAENDPVNAVEYGRKSVAKGLNYSQISLLKKIYAKDADKGAEFAQIITDKIKSEKINPENTYIVNSLLQSGDESLGNSKKDGKKPMFSEQNLRDLAEIAAQAASQNDERMYVGGSEFNLLEKYAPSRAAQLRAQIKAKETRTVVSSISNVNSPPPPPPPVRMNSNSVNRMNSNSQIDPQKETDEQLAKNLESLKDQQLPKEEREKVVTQARKLITEQMPNKLARITALGALASQIAKMGDKDLAEQIMNDAQTLVNLQPKNYQDFIEVLMLVSGYAQTAPDKAFPILDEAIFRINETISALIKVGEFVDVSGEMIDNNEVQLGSLSGGGLGEMTRGLAMADGTIRLLAASDFEKTRALTNRFDRPEARILAKMLVLRAVLGDNKKAGDQRMEDQY